MAEGFVYILTNEFMPGLVKIGYTNRTPEQRAWELYEKRTGVPGKFHVAFRLKCRDAKALEHKVHRKLAEHRVNAYREFFKCDLYKAIEAIDSCCISQSERSFLEAARAEYQVKNDRIEYSEKAKNEIIEKYEPSLNSARKKAMKEAKDEKGKLILSLITALLFSALLVLKFNVFLGLAIAYASWVYWSVLNAACNAASRSDPEYLKLKEMRDRELEELGRLHEQ